MAGVILTDTSVRIPWVSLGGGERGGGTSAWVTFTGELCGTKTVMPIDL